jgi:CoA-transferase family III
MPHLPASTALQRFRVVDLTEVRAGPTACRQLADWGADVIQVQMPEHMRGDDTLGGQDGSDFLKTSPDIDTALCTSLIRGCFDSDDYTEGRTAFMQKRKPVFTGR